MQALMNALTQANPGKPMNPAAQPQQQPTGVMPMRPAIMPPQNTGVVPPHMQTGGYGLPTTGGPMGDAYHWRGHGGTGMGMPGHVPFQRPQQMPSMGGLIGLGDGRRR